MFQISSGRQGLCCDEAENIDIPNYLTGCWKEPNESEPNINYQIRELRFDADGFFSVTWFPFEVYKDYWGSYEFNSNSGSVSMPVSGGNYIPETLDLIGNVQTNQNNELIFLNMYLGAPPSSTNNELHDNVKELDLDED